MAKDPLPDLPESEPSAEPEIIPEIEPEIVPEAGPGATLSGKHRATIAAVMARPTRANIRYDDVKAALIALGCEFFYRGGSKVTFISDGRIFYMHRPHPQPQLKKVQVKAVRDLLTGLGY